MQNEVYSAGTQIWKKLQQKAAARQNPAAEMQTVCSNWIESSYILSGKHQNLQSSHCVPFSLVQFGGSVEENRSCGPLLSGSGFSFTAKELGAFQKMLLSLTVDFQEENKCSPSLY